MEDYRKLVEYWDRVFAEREEELRPEELGDGLAELAPSIKQFDALLSLKEKERVLDYGCGDGWASLIMAANGTKRVVSCDVAPSSIVRLSERLNALGFRDVIEPMLIDERWLSKQEDESFDGFFSSNVIDVVPLEMAEDIVKETSRVVKKGSPVIFSLNYFASPEDMKKRGFHVEGHQVYIEGILRLTALTDEEWMDIFHPYFQVEKLTYFAWPGETRETRRLFFLTK